MFTLTEIYVFIGEHLSSKLATYRGLFRCKSACLSFSKVNATVFLCIGDPSSWNSEQQSNTGFEKVRDRFSIDKQDAD